MSTKAVITLTTIPQRLHSLDPRNFQACVRSLINQEYDNYEIHINIPSVYVYQNTPYVVPEWLKELSHTYPKLKIFDNLEDIGCITKVFYTVHRITDPDTVIIVCDDDMIYHPKMVTEQVKNQAIYENTSVGYDGLQALCITCTGDQWKDTPFNDHLRDYRVVSTYKNVYVNMLQHYKTVSYKRSFFKDDFTLEFATKSHSDDLNMAGYMGKQGIKKMVTFYEDEEKLIDNEAWKNKGGTNTFPVLDHTVHGGVDEGCWLYRNAKLDENWKFFTDNGYLR